MPIPTQQKKFGGESYSLVTNYETKAKANADAKVRRQKQYKVRIYRWKREDGAILYAIYARRGKRFQF